MRRPGYSWTPTSSPGYFAREANNRAYQHQGNSQVRWPGYSYQQTTSPGYYVREANDRAYQHQGTNIKRHPNYFAHRAYQHQECFPVRGPGFSYQQRNVGGYSYNLANDRGHHEPHHQVQSRQVTRTGRQTSRMVLYVQPSTQGNEMGAPRRRMGCSNRGTRLSLSLQFTGI